MLRETLKQEIDNLSDNQLREVAEFLTSIKPKRRDQGQAFWPRATPAERADDFRKWVAQLPQTKSH